MFQGLVVTTFLVVFAASQAQSAAAGGCHLGESHVTSYLKPVLLLVRGTSATANFSTSQAHSPKECYTQINVLIPAMHKLADSNRIVVPDASQDAAITDFRYQKAAEAFEALKQVVDAPTLKFLNQLEPELQQIKSKIEETKKSPEYTFLRMIFNNTANAAANNTELLPNKAEFALKVADLGYDPRNTTYLKYLITYANEFDSYDISISVYKQLFQKMKKNSQLSGPEVLLLFYCLDMDLKDDDMESQTKEIKLEYLEFATMVKKYKDDRVDSMVADIGNLKYSKFQELGEGYSDDVLSFFLPEIIEKYYTPAPIPNKVANLIDIFKILPYNDNDCVAVNVLYHELSKHNQEESFEAFALFMYTQYVMFEEGGYEQVEDVNKEKCSYVLEALSEFKDKYVNKYVKLIGRKEWATLIYWHKTYTYSMRTVLPDVVENAYTGNKDDISCIIELTENLPYLEDDCVTHEKLFSKVLEFKQENTFEALEEFASLRASIQLAKESEMVEKYLSKCESVKEQAPEWIRRLLWADTKSCKITNRKFQESLVISDETINTSDLAGFKSVYTLKIADLNWNLAIDKDGLTSFEGDSELFILHNNVADKPFSSKDGIPEDSSNDWRLEHADDDYFYIYYERTLENDVKQDLYLSAEEKLCHDKFRCIELLPRADHQQMQWKIEC